MTTDADSSGQETCPECNGEGGHYYTVDAGMARDAGQPERAGERIKRQCWKCGGDGWILADASPAPAVQHAGEFVSGKTEIYALEFPCPKCDAYHVDEGEWEKRPHRTHLCLSCGHEFAVTVRGVLPAPAVQTNDDQPLLTEGQRERLETFFRPEKVEDVISRPARAFGGQAAIDWIRQGRFEEVVAVYERATSYESQPAPAVQQGEWHVFGTAVCRCTDNEHFTTDWVANCHERWQALTLKAKLNALQARVTELEGEREEAWAAYDRRMHDAVKAIQRAEELEKEVHELKERLRDN